jgi:DNA-binding Lrp family transcriptional regulator
MVYAFVMIETTPGGSEATAEAVRAVDRIVEAHVVAGEYDVIAEVEAPEVYDVLGTAADGIRALEGVVDTRTYIAMG